MIRTRCLILALTRCTQWQPNPSNVELPSTGNSSTTGVFILASNRSTASTHVATPNLLVHFVQERLRTSNASSALRSGKHAFRKRTWRRKVQAFRRDDFNNALCFAFGDVTFGQRIRVEDDNIMDLASSSQMMFLRRFRRCCSHVGGFFSRAETCSV